MPHYAANTIAGPQNRDETESGICENQIGFREFAFFLRCSSAAPADNLDVFMVLGDHPRSACLSETKTPRTGPLLFRRYLARYMR
jgi:hypothetical protein